MSELRLKNLRRSTTDAKFFGVCGGIAEWLGMSALVVRIIVIAMAFLVPPFTFIGYFTLAFLLDKSPITSWSGRRLWSDDGTASAVSPGLAVDVLEKRYSAIEVRLRRAEAEVTSTGFRINRELRGVGR